MTKGFFFIFLITCSFLQGCRVAGFMPRLATGAYNYETEKGDFIELNNGTIIDGEISKEDFSKLSKGITKHPFAVNGQSYKIKDIKAFQSQNRYFRKGAGRDCAERIVKGRINVFFEHLYRTDSKGRTWDDYLFYLQKGSNEPLVLYEDKVLKKMTEDYSPAVEEFNKYSDLSNKEKRFKGSSYLDRVIKVYNER